MCKYVKVGSIKIPEPAAKPSAAEPADHVSQLMLVNLYFFLAVVGDLTAEEDASSNDISLK